MLKRCFYCVNEAKKKLLSRLSLSQPEGSGGTNLVVICFKKLKNSKNSIFDVTFMYKFNLVGITP